GGAANNRTEVYLKPERPPTRSDFVAAATAPAAEQHLLLPVAAPTTWYVLVYSPAVPAPGKFQLTATAIPVLVNALAPDHASNGADAVLTVTGAGFAAGTTAELVAADGTAFGGVVQLDSPEQLTARFAAGTIPQGTYALRLRRPD